MILLADIEANNLWPGATRVWCACVKQYKQERWWKFKPDQMDDVVSLLNGPDVSMVVFHNGTTFDRPVLEAVSRRKIHTKMLDTLVCSRLLFPDMSMNPVGGHALADWGKFLKMPKGEFDDWSCWSQAMEDYCCQDVRVLERIVEYVLPRVQRMARASRLEHKVAEIIAKQVWNGVGFSEAGTIPLERKLTEATERCLAELRASVGPLTKGKKQILFNPGSSKQIIAVLRSQYGWEPTELTETGEPSTQESVLEQLDFPIIPQILEYKSSEKRLSLLSQLQAASRGGIIHGHVNPLGTVTSRMAHSDPPLGQIPKIRKDKKTKQPVTGRAGKFGFEFRSLFMPTRPGWLQVGMDASSLEYRMLAHNLAAWDKGFYAKLVCEGDIHAHNMKLTGCEDRDQMKTGGYGHLYGAGDAKLGKIFGGDEALGAAMRKRLEHGTVGMVELLDLLNDQKKRSKHIVGLDGRLIPVRSDHSILNTKLQSDGAIVMKQALVHASELDAVQAGRAFFMLNVHDEMQLESEPGAAESLPEQLLECIKEAEHDLEVRCPLSGEAKVGYTWAETH